MPDLLEAIMRPTDPVKDELRQKLSKIDQFESKIKKIRVSTFWIPEIQSFAPQANASLLTSRF